MRAFWSIQTKKEKGIDDSKKEGGGEEEGCACQMDVEVVETGQDNGVDASRRTGGDEDGADDDRVSEKLCGDKVADEGGEDEFDSHQDRDAVIVASHFCELDGIADRKQGCPSGYMDEEAKEITHNWGARDIAGVEQHACDDPCYRQLIAV